jgi:hypothetical protein
MEGGYLPAGATAKTENVRSSITLRKGEEKWFTSPAIDCRKTKKKC